MVQVIQNGVIWYTPGLLPLVSLVTHGVSLLSGSPTVVNNEPSLFVPSSYRGQIRLLRINITHPSPAYLSGFLTSEECCPSLQSTQKCQGVWQLLMELLHWGSFVGWVQFCSTYHLMKYVLRVSSFRQNGGIDYTIAHRHTHAHQSYIFLLCENFAQHPA